MINIQIRLLEEENYKKHVLEVDLKRKVERLKHDKSELVRNGSILRGEIVELEMNIDFLRYVMSVVFE